MTVVADEKRRVSLPAIQPGDTFQVQVAGDGKIVLTLIESLSQAPTKVHVEKHNGFSVGVLDRPIDEQALQQALEDFP